MSINNKSKQIRKLKKITSKEDIDFFINLKEEDITLKFIMRNFGEYKGKRKYDPFNAITIPPKSYGLTKYKNENSIETTVGIFIFNKYFIEKDLLNIFGYINEPITKKVLNRMQKQLIHAVIEDEIDLSLWKRFLQKTQKFQPYVTVLAENHSLYLLTSEKAFEKKKKEIYNKYKDEIEKGNELAMNKVEEEMLAYAKEYMKGDPAMDSYDSGARGSFGNNFKNMFLLKGLYNSPDPNEKPTLLLSNYMNGIKKEEYSTFANSLAAGPYSRAIKTASGGHMEKIFITAFQSIVLGKAGTDCGTKRTVEIFLNDDNIDLWMYSYIVDGRRLVELNSKTMDRYINSKVKIRYAGFCESHSGVCNKCAGNLFYRLGINNLGMGSAQLPSKLKTLNMKSFHDQTMEFTEMNPMKVFGLE